MSFLNNIFNGMARGFAFGMMGFNPFFGSPCCCNYNPLFMTSNPFFGGGFFPVMPQISMPIFNMTAPSWNFSSLDAINYPKPDFSKYNFSSIFEEQKATNPFISNNRSDSSKSEIGDTFSSKAKKTSNENSKSKFSTNKDLSTKDNTEYDSLIKKYSEEYGVDPNLVKAVIHQESKFNPKARSKCDAYGLMQLMPATAKHLGVNRYDVEENIKGGVKYLKELLDRFDGNVKLAVAAYNAGPNRECYSRGEIPNIKETKNYVAKVLEYYDEYSCSA